MSGLQNPLSQVPGGLVSGDTISLISWEPHIGTGEGLMGAFSSSCTLRKPLLHVWILLPEKICALYPVVSLLKFIYRRTLLAERKSHLSL